MATTKKRIDWIDSAKGIAIILTIVGHCVSYNFYGSVIRGLIFSFHMPLFFILSVMTYNNSENIGGFIQNAKKAAKHLLIPALVVYAILMLYELVIHNGLVSNGNYWTNKLFTLFMASGVDVNFRGRFVFAIGIPWFFFALFFGRTMFDFIQMYFKKIALILASVLLTYVGVRLGQGGNPMPFSIDIALASMLLFMTGYFLRRLELGTKAAYIMLVSGIIWLVSLYLTFPDYKKWTYMELACRRYPIFPLCFVCAISGTLFLSTLCILLNRYLKVLMKPINFLGKYSLYLLCIHAVDTIWTKHWHVHAHQMKTALYRVAIDIVVFIVVMIIKYILDRLSGGSRKVKRK